MQAFAGIARTQQGAQETSASVARWMRNECRPTHVREKGGRALPHLDSTICAARKRPLNSPMFYPVKGMRVVPILCAGMLVQAAAGQNRRRGCRVGTARRQARAATRRLEDGDRRFQEGAGPEIPIRLRPGPISEPHLRLQANWMLPLKRIVTCWNYRRRTMQCE